jgi:general secretion pathway protein L
MARLLLQFTSEELAGFRWASIDETVQTADIEWQSAEEEELAAVASQNPHPVIMILPQQCVYLTQVELPERGGRQLLSAIEYQVEDQLAQDIETQHFALGDSTANPISVAVVGRSIMMRCMALAQGHGLRLLQIMPELFLCPWPGSGIVVTQGYEGCLLRYGDYRGLKCNAQALPAMLELVKREVEFDDIIYYACEEEPTPEIDGYQFERRALADARPGFVDAPIIDLQQRDYQLSSAWQALGKAWKWIALLFAALLVVGAYNKAIALQTLEQELAGIKQQQYELLKPYLPATVSADDNLKKALIERLKQLQSNQRDQGFLQLMLDFTRAQAKFPDVKITRVGYQDRQLSFDIRSTELNSIEALLAAVQKLGVEAELVSLSIKPEFSSGRLVMQGGDDV